MTPSAPAPDNPPPTGLRPLWLLPVTSMLGLLALVAIVILISEYEPKTSRDQLRQWSQASEPHVRIRALLRMEDQNQLQWDLIQQLSGDPVAQVRANAFHTLADLLQDPAHAPKLAEAERLYSLALPNESDESVRLTIVESILRITPEEKLAIRLQAFEAQEGFQPVLLAVRAKHLHDLQAAADLLDLAATEATQAGPAQRYALRYLRPLLEALGLDVPSRLSDVDQRFCIAARRAVRDAVAMANFVDAMQWQQQAGHRRDRFKRHMHAQGRTLVRILGVRE